MTMKGQQKFEYGERNGKSWEKYALIINVEIKIKDV